jgi:hypothetical protein
MAKAIDSNTPRKRVIPEHGMALNIDRHLIRLHDPVLERTDLTFRIGELTDSPLITTLFCLSAQRFRRQY